MEVVLPQANLVTKVLGAQKLDVKIKYRPLKYLLITKYSNIYLIYNLMTKALIVVSESEYKLFNAPCIEYTKEIDNFIINWYLVPVESNEEKINEQLLSFAKLLNCSNLKYFNVLTTTDCNARCFYCYEKGINHENMPMEVAADVANYIYENHKKGDEISLCWFGGEPLFNIEPINIISNYLLKNNVNFKSLMVTNGYLFDRDIIKTAKQKWHLQALQLTLDGTEDIYNNRKKYINLCGESAYKRVLNNIDDLLRENIQVVIRYNTDEQNISNLFDLSNELFARFNNEKLKIYIEPIIGMCIKSDQVDYERFINKYFDLEDYIWHSGFYYINPLKNSIKANACMADNDSSVLIMPNGDLGKCDNELGKRKIGSIYTGIVDKETILYYKEKADSYEECKQCQVKPECIRLKHCVFQQSRCNSFIKKRFYRRIERSVINTYLLYLKTRRKYN